MTKTKVIIIGGGFAGLNAAQALKRADVEILMIDRMNHHLFQPLLYQVATAALSPADIATPIREILAWQKNASVIMANVSRIDKANKKVYVDHGESYAYDYLILAPGANHSYFGRPEWEKDAPGLKTLSDAIGIREKILRSFEEAERLKGIEDIQPYLNFVVIGGGPTGVEMAGSISEIARKSMSKNFRKINPEQAKVYLIEGAAQVLPSYPLDLAKKAYQSLEKMGVTVYLNSYVTEVKANGVKFGEHFIPSQNIVWAAGNQASPLLKTLDVPLDKQGRVFVEPDLSVPGAPDIFVVGDAAALNNLPGIAPVAIQEGRYVAKLIRTGDRKPFKYFDKGMMATIGKAKAVAVVGRFQFSGFFAWIAWTLIHILYLISFANRYLVMSQWVFWYLTNQRRVRLIVNRDDKKNSIS